MERYQVNTAAQLSRVRDRVAEELVTLKSNQKSLLKGNNNEKPDLDTPNFQEDSEEHKEVKVTVQGNLLESL